MTAQDKKSTSWIEIIENFERLVFYTSLLVIPISIVPLPWDLTEFSMGLSLMFFSSLLLTIELVKLVWKGRLLIPKASIDLGLLILSFSILLSTAFSVSLPSSLWGFDFRLGSGTMIFVLALVYLFSVRSFLFKIEEVLNSLKFFVVGSFIGVVFSIFSFFGMNILGFSHNFGTLFTTGLPIFSSSRISVVVWGLALLFSIYFASSSFKRKSLPFAFFNILSTLVHTIGIFLFTLAQGWQIYALITFFVTGTSFYFATKSKNKEDRAFNTILFTTIGVSILFFFASLIPFVRTSIGGASSSLITQITITADSTLKIATQALSQNIFRSLIGMGQDTFSISYNQFRPLNDQAIVINGTNFTNANNQIFNILTNRGLIGFGVWIFLGYLIFKYVYSNFKQNTLENEKYFALAILDSSIVYLFLTSFFIYHTFIIIFLFLFVISMSVSVKNIVFKDKLEVYVINWGIFTHTSGNIGMRNAFLGVSAIFVLSGLLFNFYSIKLGASAYNALVAETITADARGKIETLSESDKVKILVDAANRYASAIRYNPNNDVLHRRASLIVSQYLESLASQYNKTDDESAKKDIFDQISTYVEISVEESKKSTELAPKVYANWAARSNVYSKLVGLGLTSYTKSALTTLQNSASLNPLNYEVYYNAAQLYILNNETDTALRTLNQLFSINPKHIPSLILAGEISLKDKDFKQSERFFTDAKKVMEETNSTANEIYDYVNKKLKELESDNPKTEDTKPATVKTTQETSTEKTESNEVSE